MLKRIFQKIFPVTVVEDKYLRITYVSVFGLKLLYRVRAKELDLSPILNSVVDITQIPKARGKRRRLQLADMKLLKIFDAISRKYDFPYYLCGGTLLGAVRHHGLVPWDDDIDVSVPSEMYDKVIDILEREFAGTNLKLWGVDDTRLGDATLRVSHRNFPSLNMDIFYAYCFTKEAGDRETVRKAWEEAHRRYTVDFELMQPDENREKIRAFKKETDEYYKSLLPGAVDFFSPDAYAMTTEIHWRYYRYIKMSDVLPLTTLAFEDMECPVPHNPLNYLKEQYGDIFQFPPHFHHHDSVFMDFNEDELGPIEAELDEILSRYQK